MTARAIVAFHCLFLFPVTALAQWPALNEVPAVDQTGPNDVAVIVAVEDYLMLPDVDGAVQNANDWEIFLRNGLGLKNVTVLANQDATRESMLKFAKKAANAAGPNSTVWWVFIGHGAPTVKGDDGLLVGMDAQQSVESLEARGLPQKELIGALQKGPQKNTVVLVDACFSGRSGSGTALAAGVQPVVPVKLTPKLTGKTIVMSAAKATEVAGQLPGSPRPAFSYLMLGALRGWADSGDGQVTAEEALLFAQRELRNVKGRQQTPQILGAGEVVLARNVSEQKPSTQQQSPGSGGACPVGMMKSADTDGHCCWPGQAWAEAQGKCIGQPVACPTGYTVVAHGCAPAAGHTPQASTSVPGKDWSTDPRVEEYMAKRIKVYLGQGPTLKQDTESFEDAEVYEVLGRPDLAAKWKPWMPSLVIAGAAAIGVGLGVWAITGADFMDAQGDDTSMAEIGVFSVGVAGGLSLALGGVLAESNPVSGREVVRMVKQKNKELRRSLGLPADIDKKLGLASRSVPMPATGPRHADRSTPFGAPARGRFGINVFQVRF